MNVEFKKSFARDLEKIRDRRLLARVEETIVAVERAQSLREIPGIKKLREGDHYYRLGLVVKGSTITFVRFLHRRDVYRYFP